MFSKGDGHGVYWFFFRRLANCTLKQVGSLFYLVWFIYSSKITRCWPVNQKKNDEPLTLQENIDRCMRCWDVVRYDAFYVTVWWSLLWVKITHSPENEMCIASQWNTREWKMHRKKKLLTKRHNISVAFSLNSQGNSLVPGSDKTQVAPNKWIC